MTLVVLVDAAEAIRADAVARHVWLADLRLASIGWATVELERAARELGPVLDPALDPALGATVDAGSDAAWMPAPRDAHLGATAWRWAGARKRSRLRDDGPEIVLLEPDTEGRLAATLARFGEGVAAIYLARGVADGADTAGAADTNASSRAGLSHRAESPLGQARVLLGGPPWGPHVLLLEPSSESLAARPSNQANTP